MSRRSLESSRAARVKWPTDPVTRARTRFTLDSPPFAGRTGAGITVAVLDSGIHSAHPHIGGTVRGISFIGETTHDDYADRIGHGTAVAAVIREKSPGAELVAVRIFDRKLATNASVLADAIVWSADSGAQLINLSLGTANPAHASILADAVDHAMGRGALVVSARESNDVAWLPGSLENVAGVVADWTGERDALEVARRDDGSLAFSASAYPRPIPNVPRERNLSGVSFAVANVTGFLARAAEDAGCDPFEALRRL
jgi:subtilisin family serine protease